ncbi:hypothetical protein ABW19_dt0207960 [Dactylella cylindrospora]|nr:hypothetical protein ABW19_dt0207960 [Dactylella cylindrospora]
MTHRTTHPDDAAMPPNPLLSNDTNMERTDNDTNRILPVHLSTSPSYPDIVMTEPTYKSASFLDPPSSPPPLYSYTPSSSSNSRDSSPPNGGAYRPESMLYSRTAGRTGTPMHSPSLSAISDSSSIGLLTKSEQEAEKNYISASRDMDGDSSYHGPTPSDSDYEGEAADPTKSHVRGKRFLSYFRTLFALFNCILSLLSLVMIAIVIWGIYSPNKSLTSHLPDDKTSTAIHAFPQTLNPLPNNLIIGTSFIGLIFNITALLCPCWRSNKKFHKKRYSNSEVYEMLLNLVIIAAGAAGVYFSFNEKEDLEKSMWGYVCSRSPSHSSSSDTKTPSRSPAASDSSSGYPEAALFPDINYANACNNYNAAVYILLGVVILSAVSLMTFAVNPCLKRKKGEYKKDDSKYCTGVADCCGACGVSMIDCGACCGACCNCCT